MAPAKSWRIGSRRARVPSTTPDGFEGFELLRPTDDRDQWLVLTRWRDDAAFQAWVESPSFAEGHRSAVERAGGEAPRPVSTHSEVWSYEIAGGSKP